jgi:hypothetical protein
MGKLTDPKSDKAAAEFNAQHNANLIGQAVANSLRNHAPE